MNLTRFYHKKASKIFLFILAAALVASPFLAGQTVHGSASYLYVSGTSLYDSAGQVVLRGVMVGDTFGLWGVSPSDASINAIANGGCNFYQYEALDWAVLEPSSGSYSSSYLAALDGIASQCAADHMYFMFDFMGLSQGAEWDVEPVPPWADVADSYSAAGDYPDHYINFEVNFWNMGNSAYTTARADFAACLKMLVSRYESNPYFMVGLMNEPYNTGMTTSYMTSLDLTDNPTYSGEYAQTVTWLYNQITSTGYSGIVEVDNPWCNIALADPAAPTGSNIVWDCHAYVCTIWGTTLSGWETSVGTFKSQYMTALDHPIVMGEWGVLNASGYESDQIPDWSTVESTFASQIAYINSLGIAGSSWFCGNCLTGGPDVAEGFMFSPSESTTILSLASQGAASPSPSATPTPTGPTPTPTPTPTAAPTPTSTPTPTATPTPAPGGTQEAALTVPFNTTINYGDVEAISSNYDYSDINGSLPFEQCTIKDTLTDAAFNITTIALSNYVSFEAPSTSGENMLLFVSNVYINQNTPYSGTPQQGNWGIEYYNYTNNGSPIVLDLAVGSELSFTINSANLVTFSGGQTIQMDAGFTPTAFIYTSSTALTGGSLNFAIEPVHSIFPDPPPPTSTPTPTPTATSTSSTGTSTSTDAGTGSSSAFSFSFDFTPWILWGIIILGFLVLAAIIVQAKTKNDRGK
jgi:hypothetical protein